jgi:hypothetical protein
MGMTLQQGVPGAGGRNAGDPAPGRSPGPPLMSDTSSNLQKRTVPPDSARKMARDRPEVSAATRFSNLNASLPESYVVTRSYSKHQSTAVDESSSSHYREDVTQEYTRPTLGQGEFSSPFSRFNGNGRITNTAEKSSGYDDEYTSPVLKEAKNLGEHFDVDYYQRGTWHQGGILDDTEYDQDRIMSEDDPTIILTSDSDQLISLPTYTDFSSYEEEEESNGTKSWCDGVMRADVEVATNQWGGLINVSVLHPLFRTDIGLVRALTYQGKHTFKLHGKLIDSPLNQLQHWTT